MLTFGSLLRTLYYIGLLLSFAWMITQKQFDWLLYTGFSFMLSGAAYTLFDNWRSGHKKLFWLKLGYVVLFMAICLAQTS